MSLVQKPKGTIHIGYSLQRRRRCATRHPANDGDDDDDNGDDDNDGDDDEEKACNPAADDDVSCNLYFPQQQRNIALQCLRSLPTPKEYCPTNLFEDCQQQRNIVALPMF